MASLQEKEILKFVPLQSFVHDTFWHKLSEIKLEHDRLSDAPKTVHGFYTNRNAKSCLLELDYSAFNNDFNIPKFCFGAQGTLYNKNTIEEFKECDKNELLAAEGRKLLKDFETGHALENPSVLARFFVLSFGDLKSYSFYYWFAFPCPLTPTLSVVGEAIQLKAIPKLLHFESILNDVSNKGTNFFVLKLSQPNKFFTLIEVLLEGAETNLDVSDICFCFADPSEFEQPSWLMRTYAALIFYKCPFLISKDVKFLGIRFSNDSKFGRSLLWTVRQEEYVDLIKNATTVKFVGWEANKNKMLPKFVSMEKSMDPEILAENSAHLNLKLMKWRLVPELNLEIIAATKCLLLGAGTLGCAVARNLLSWGFKHITFVDSGKVGFSNPVRQNLYTHADAVVGNKMKATAAAEHLKEINPKCVTTGHNIQIPMPGHTVGASMQKQTELSINTIKTLVQEHDVIFLLTDSRESRWLPTLLGATFQKIVINAALGFDSFLVMRHGSRRSRAQGDEDNQTIEEHDIGDLKCISGVNLGCYFCNDITAPGNSLRERTLDQQCTVTRPGVSNIAASYAVELLVSLLQHPLRELAPAYYSTSDQPKARVPEGLLGIIPHSIRGMLFSYENMLPATRKFTQCIACSEIIVSEYKKAGDDFLFKAFETAKYLEDLTGISEFKDLNSAIIDFDDSDLEMSDA